MLKLGVSDDDDESGSDDDDGDDESDQCIYFYDLKEDLYSIKTKKRDEKLYNFLHPVVKTATL